jgi:hypothetical protein
VGFDAYDSGGTPGSLCGVADQSIGPDVAAVTVRVDGTLVLQHACSVRNGNCADPNSIQTGGYDGSGGTASLCWAHLKVQLATDGKLSVWWKGSQILTNYQTTYYPSPGRLVFAGRTGSLWQNQDVDNILISTVAATVAQVGNATGQPDGFTLPVTDSGQIIADPATATAKLDGVSVTPLNNSKSGNVTTFSYHGFPTLLVPGSIHDVVFACNDAHGNPINATRTFTVPAYPTIPATDAVASGVDLAKPGYRLLPWQSDGQPNRTYWTEEQLLGLHGRRLRGQPVSGHPGSQRIEREHRRGASGVPQIQCRRSLHHGREQRRRIPRYGGQEPQGSVRLETG